MDKIFPDHWSFMVGEIAMYTFVILMATGIYLALFYKASDAIVIYHGSYKPLDGQAVTEAYASTVNLSFSVRAGLVIRQAHHWAALIFLAAIAFHMCRVFFTGAFRRPREINWIIGVTLLLLAMLEGFSGYSLPDDLLSGSGLRVVFSIVESIPFVGVWLAFTVWGGQFPGHIVLRTAVRHPRVPVPVTLGRPPRGPPRHPLAPDPHRFPRAGQNRAEHRRQPAMAPVHGQVDRSADVHCRRHIRARRPCPDQPDLDLRPLPGRPSECRHAARLVRRLARRRSASVAALGVPKFWPRAGQPVLPGLAAARASSSRSYTPGLGSTNAFTRTTAHHNLLDRPRDKPLRTAIGVAALIFFIDLTLASATDVIGTGLHISFELLIEILQYGSFIGPIVGLFVAYEVCLVLQRTAAHPIQRPVGGIIIRDAQGGYHTVGAPHEGNGATAPTPTGTRKPSSSGSARAREERQGQRRTTPPVRGRSAGRPCRATTGTPGRRSRQRLPMFENLAVHNKIVVTGPQRSGTRIGAQMIAADTGHQFVDEAEFLIKDSDLFREFLQRDGVVVQAPHMLKDVVDDPPPGILIVLMRRGPGPDPRQRRSYPVGRRVRWQHEGAEEVRAHRR